MFNRAMTTRARILSGGALLALALAPAYAQEAETQDQQTQGQAQAEEQAQTQEDQSQAQEEQSQTQDRTTEDQQGQQADALIATVGDADVRSSEVLAVIEAMPQNVRQQPRELLVPLAIEQLVLRELILQQAIAENLAEDADVQAMVEERSQMAEEDAMVSVWLQREMEGRVTDEAVQQTYDRLQRESDQELPPLEAVRPQIEQQLGRQAIEGIRSELSDNISVVYYGPDGEPIETTAEAEAGATPEGQEGSAGAGGSDGEDGADGSTGEDGAGGSNGGSGAAADGDQTGDQSSD